MSGSALKAPIGKWQAGDVLARITSLTPTRYMLLEGGRDEPIYVYCALDTFVYAWVTGGSCRVVAEPPVGGAVRFTLTPSGPEPVAAWMSNVPSDHVAQLPAVGRMPSRCCPYTHFFISKDAYAAWNDALPEGIRPHIQCLSVHEAWLEAQRALMACAAARSCQCR